MKGTTSFSSLSVNMSHSLNSLKQHDTQTPPTKHTGYKTIITHKLRERQHNKHLAAHTEDENKHLSAEKTSAASLINDLYGHATVLTC